MSRLASSDSKVDLDLAEHRQTFPLAATLLAAGVGQRLGGRPKSALRIGDSTMLERLVAALQGAGIRLVNVVLGPYQDQLLPLIERSGAQPLIHQLQSPSLVDSQRLAVRFHVSQFPDHDLLMVLADLPLLNTQDVLHVLSHWRQREPGLEAMRPIVDGARGHPLLLSSRAVRAVNSTPDNQGVRDWLNAHSGSVWHLPCSSRAYITDLDTNEDLLKLQALIQPTPVTW